MGELFLTAHQSLLVPWPWPQEHYRQAVAQRLAALRRQHGHNPAQLAELLAREALVLEAALEVSVRGDLSAFVEQVCGL